MSPFHQYRERDYAFGQLVLTLRTTLGLTQAGLADLLGISRRAVTEWEAGSNYPKAERLKVFIELGVQASAFAAGHEEEQIRAFWRAARLKALLDEHWLSELLSRPSLSSGGHAGEPSGGGWQSSTTPSKALAIWMVPYLRNPHFTGRNDLLDHLQRQFARSEAEQPTTLQHASLTQAQAIKGLGGIGKTQTAIEYAYRGRERGRYTHTLWISASSEEAVLSSFASLKNWVPDLAPAGESDQRVLTDKALRWLEQCPDPWLLIYDNADDITFLPVYLPKEGRGSILFTTRASAVGALAPSLEVDVLSLKDAIQLLLRRAGWENDATPQDREEASTIAQELGRFPLALDQSGAYLEETGCSFADYLELYQERQHSLLARRGKQVTGYPDSVATTWSLAFERIEEGSPAAAELLRLCAFVAPDQIPEELLTQGAAFWPATLQEAVMDRLRFNQMLSTLLAFSLIKRFGREHQLSIHRLVQAVQQARMTKEEQHQWAERLVFAVHAVFPHEPEDVAAWQGFERLLHQALACETLIEQHQFQQASAADLLDRTGSYLRERGLYSQAEPLVRRALGMREQLLGPAHLDVATSLYHLGIIYWRQGNYSDVEPLYQRALRIREQQLGPQHHGVAEPLNDLALLYTSQGKYVQAEPLYLRALSILERQLGLEHSRVADVLSNLALLYTYQGKYTQAESLYQQALRIYEQHLGPAHPRVATLLHNLALLYTYQGKYTQAESLYQRALRIYEQHLGPEHSEVGVALLNLANLYCEQGQYRHAEPLSQRALRIYEQQPGPEHPGMALALHYLALVTAKQGQYEEAERLDRQALCILEERLGAEHPFVTYPLHGLALLFATLGREQLVEALFQRALYLREQHLGPEHIETAKVLHDLAGFQQAQGRTQEAAIMYQRTLAIRENVLGPDHSLTRDTLSCLQEVLGTLGRTQEAALFAERHQAAEQEG
ncbi:MAG TPA: FxSxx-COOH system tetratricopeptide repeat protein [Ktedonobacteraceae bacterium]|jgi:tetratricopeptide (TPR) repeat protein/transcriptional regulator with XRE-family HTH domain